MKFNTLAIAMLTALLAGKSMATTPPSPVWHTIALSDGSSSEAILRGTADFHWFEDKQGNALLQEDGVWFFARIQRESDTPILISTGVVKTQSSEPPESARFRPDLQVKPQLSSLKTIEPMARKNLLRSAQGYQAMSSSTVKQQPLLVVQVSFDDQAMVHDFEQRVFNTNGQSVVDYFDKNSQGKFKVVPALESYGTANDGVIDVTVAQSHPNCHSSSTDKTCTAKLNAVFTEAYQKLDPYFNLSAYDSNQNGTVEPSELSVMFIFAGGDRSTGVLNRPAIWPHKFSHDDVTLDGKKITDYCVFADYQVDHQATLGVIVHELGHLMLGLPDLYARNSDASIGSWGVMGGGSWAQKPGDSYAGDTPVNMSAWSKHAAGFVVPTVTHESPAPISVNNDDVKLVYLDPYLKEFGPRIYLENRTFSGYDRALAAEGILATSVNVQNRFNDVGAMQVQIMQADGLNELENDGRSDADDLYPNGGDVISDTSTPGLRAITGFDTGVRISNIASNTNGGSFSLEHTNEPNKSAWLNSLHQGYVYASGSNTLAVSLDLNSDTELDGLQLYAQRDSAQSDMTYRVWRFPFSGNIGYRLILNQNNAELLQQGNFQKSSRILFPQSSQLSAGQHLLVVELEGGQFDANFDFGRLLKTEKASLPVMWTGDYSEIGTFGLEKAGFSYIPFAALLNVDASNLVEAKSDSLQTNKNTPIKLNLMDNDFMAVGYQFNVDIVQKPEHGTISGNQYQPEANFVGLDTFQYRLLSVDGAYSSSIVNVQVEVLGSNEAPVAVIDVDNKDMTVGQRVTLSALNSTDADGDVLSYKWEQLAGTSVSLGNATSVSTSFTVPQGAKAGEVLTFRLTVTDPSNEASSATVDLTMKNAAPLTLADTATVAVGESILIDAASNDSDVNGDKLVVESVQNVTGVGSASVENGKIRFQAPDSPTDGIKLQYTVSDGHGATATGEVIVTVVASLKTTTFKNSEGSGSVSYWALMLLATLGWRRRV
ncbi:MULTISPECIES: M6 family metalloprotease domain-containing protein [Vibrio]|uniref:M6 family metalloprotease domain-containing protein n=2 Tax=Vibrionaceae TaxID=641 RepID=UPI001A8E2637|nr:MULTISPECIES: M6 family metalloprotease domain-containing protein [Vibrio]MBO0245301.1 M6 family metalloprotease domain-containing protein [Vibrio sp. Vb0592]MCR9638044.1 M6 family metalloprotease domain-containing protein [Vibrio alginolyticus]MDW1735195.1 M6 family metalloprotease domain-containing protein [Vibrio sp. Vb2235]MDW1787467.1 M6 family metalloprotease domain-containing protein [Vibrio sp. Vb2227]MDW1817225.1 M6 family metalloprotease domain-containing protein [Vibrio sp. Vb223